MHYESSSINVLLRLGGTYYVQWKSVLKSFVRSHDFNIWVLVVDGFNPTKMENSETKLKSLPTYSSEEKALVKQNLDGLNVIMHVVSRYIQHHVSTYQTSNDAWDNLNTVLKGNNIRKGS